MLDRKEPKFNYDFFFNPKADTWSLHRRLIQPTFHINTLETFLGTFVDASKVLVQRLKDGPSQLNITHSVNQCVIDILNGKSLTQKFFIVLRNAQL